MEKLIRMEKLLGWVTIVAGLSMSGDFFIKYPEWLWWIIWGALSISSIVGWILNRIIKGNTNSYIED